MKDNISTQGNLLPDINPEDKQNLYRGFQLKMIKDYHFDECASALQKSIRRSLELEAVYWAGVFYRGGYSRYLAKRLKTIIEEDIGQGNPNCLILANQIYLETQQKVYKAEESNDGFLKYVNLIILACRSNKTRIADELGNVALDLIDKLDFRLELDNDYLDPHCAVGKATWGRWDDNRDKDRALTRLNKWFSRWSHIDREDNRYNDYRGINKSIWKLHWLSDEEKENLINTVKEIIQSKRQEVHDRIKLNSLK